uniref:CCHC-type domain-containing protein n=1 Tax=Pogona vitticeps TaxID=103695 RepID=A0ABM5F2B3_9SAUR
MPLTRSQVADMSEVKDPQIDQGSEEEFGSVQGDSTGEQDPELRKLLLAQQHELRVREMEIRRKERAEICQAEADAKKRGMAMRIKEMELKHQIRLVQLELKFLNKFINNLSVEEMSKKEKKYEAQVRQSEQDLEKYTQQKDIKLKEIRDKTEEKVKEIKARAEEEILQIRAEFEAKQKELDLRIKGKSQQGGGAHGEGKPSDMKPSPQNLEGKPKQEERESKYTRKCYFCQGKGHLISECEKLKQLKGMVPQNSSGTKPKAVFCVQKEQGSVSQREPVAIATQSGTATSADQAEENGPLVEVKRCLLIKTDSQLFETAGVDVGILDRQYRGLRDTCSQVTLCHPDIIPREFIIPNESIKVAGIEGQVISLPVAEVPVNFQGWRGAWRLAISSTLPAAVLVGNDLAEHVKRVLVITRSQATTGTVQGGTDEPETEAEGSSEAVVETLTTDSRFGQEQKADATLQKCFEQVTDAQLTPETPVRFLEKKGILYRETLRNISKGGDGIRSQLVVPENLEKLFVRELCKYARSA